MTARTTASSDPLWHRLASHPRVSDRGRAKWRLADLTAALDGRLPPAEEAPHLRPLLAAIADHSSHLWHLVDSDAERLFATLEDDPESRLDAILDGLSAMETDDEAEIMKRLRRARQSVALLIGLADLGGVWTLEQVVEALSRAADRFIATALAFLLRVAGRAGRLRITPDRPHERCGLVVLALGKLGGRELNYSSDVDLVVLFDPESPAVVDPDGARTTYVKIVRDLVRLLQQPTADGHVVRVDLRLRPEPSASAVAISRAAALLYYERFGQNWERAALIKARVVAGDEALGAAILADLAPFIWRKYFDLAAIADIHAMKRQIHAAKGGASIAVAGHDVKLGRGGIRDIEFFVQTQQLIFGGKRPDLRGSRTVPMLRQLRRDGWISKNAATDLTQAYTFLRRVEHRLQMLADAQTHQLPRGAEALERFANFCGFASSARFSEAFERHLTLVEHHYALLFEKAPRLDEAGGNLVFTGIADDPETLKTLSRLGFAVPETVGATVRAWHSGLRPAVRSPRARETLTDLVPALLMTFARASDPDAAVAGFDRMLERLPAAAELFAILRADVTLRGLFSDILGSAPRLAEAIAQHPHLLDIAIDPTVDVCLDADEMEARVTQALVRATTTEDYLDAIRDYKREEHFLVDVRLLSGALEPLDAGRAYAALAVGVIRGLFARVQSAFAVDHGRPPRSAAALLAMGRLGSAEMTSRSDLDLVLVYDFDPEDPLSDGPKPLDATTYFTRLTQRLVSHLTVATRRGPLYDVDMRLRPSGNQGPLATKLSAFVAYQRTTAATWEHMALTRARPIAGDPDLMRRLGETIADVLRTVPRPALASDIAAMRALVETEKPATGLWDVKRLPGGLIDLDFLAQFLVLRHAATLADPIGRSTRAILADAPALGALDQATSDALVRAHDLMATIERIVALALPPGLTPETAGRGFRQRVLAATGHPSIAQAKADLAASRALVRRTFVDRIG